MSTDIPEIFVNCHISRMMNMLEVKAVSDTDSNITCSAVPQGGANLIDFSPHSNGESNFKKSLDDEIVVASKTGKI